MRWNLWILKLYFLINKYIKNYIFSLCFHEWIDDIPNYLDILVNAFQSTLLRKERLNQNTTDVADLKFQSTLLRKERRHKALMAMFCIWVSIHAPTKGATTPYLHMMEDPDVSIHAPTKGATWSARWGKPVLPCFNPRSYERSDAKGSVHECSFKGFNPRSYERSDRVYPMI